MLGLIKAALGVRCYYWLADTFLRGRRRVAEAFGVYRWSRMGLYEMDKKLSRYLNFEKGVYIEAGANDGITQSNTYYLSKALAWRGILIEPVYPIYLKCKKNRPLDTVVNCALVAPDDEGRQFVISVHEQGGLMSQMVQKSDGSMDVDPLGQTIEAVGRTLTSVISDTEFKHIDFFSLDVEGYELHVLNGLDFKLFSPTIILVETEHIEKVDKLLSPLYDRVEQFSPLDYLYRKKEKGTQFTNPEL
ncbi:MAG: FkbM family methyltransferase [Kiritimatiellia bacterium]|jgi:FkbM family methyltransferase